LTIILSVATTIQSFSQIVFEKGYFVDDSNKKIECLIKNIDWKNNPTKFEYMLSQNAIVKIASIDSIKEFGIVNVSKYIRSIVKIDRSSDDITRMSSDKKPNFQEEKLFLKVLIEGKASLFLYEFNNLTRFFYSVSDSEIKQLVFKNYLIYDKISQNVYFKQQLFLDLNCQTIKLYEAENLEYTKQDLKRFFIKYHECSNFTYINLESSQKKGKFNLSFRPGFNYSNLIIQNSTSDSRDVKFDYEPRFRLGIEAEFILPYNKNKWGIIIEPVYQNYKSTKLKKKNDVNGGVLVSNINYQSIELPIGVRQYYFLNDKSKLFTDISFLFDFTKNSSIIFKSVNGDFLNTLKVSSRRNLGLSLGYKYNHKYAISMKYQTNRNILSNYLSWDSRYKTISIIMGYTLN
jgi:hypothetical protein